MPSFRHLKPGDRVLRIIGQVYPMKMIVVTVDDNYVHCNADNGKGGGALPPGVELWKFDRDTGAEEDEQLEWGVKFGATGSQLKEMP